MKISFCKSIVFFLLLLSIDARATKVLIILKSQASILVPSHLKTKDEKATHLYNVLYNHAVNTQTSILNYLTSQSAIHRSYYIVNMIYADINSSQITELKTHPDVASIIPDGNFTLPVVEVDRSGIRTTEWGLNMINAPSVWSKGYNGSGIVIGGQDTGYDWDHPALVDKYRGKNMTIINHDYNWHDAIHYSTGNPCGNNSTIPCDDNNHGTHTMGTMTGDDGAGNQIGVAPGAKWMGCRNMDEGDGTLSTYLECFEWFLAPYPVNGTPAQGLPSQAPHVINNSWSCPPSEGCNTSNFFVMEQAVNTLKAAGIVVVVSAGNSGSGCSTVSSPPAIFENSFSVGATNISDTIASFSSRGPVTVDGSGRIKPNISAPGVTVRSSIIGTGYASYSGTSMAGPHVAGAVALLLDARPDLDGDVEKIESILELTAKRKFTTQNCGSTSGNSIPNNTFGFGRLDILAAVNYMTRNIIVDNADWYLPTIGTSLILTSPNNGRWSISIDNGGNISTMPYSILSNSTNIVDASLYFTTSSKGIILTNVSGNPYKLTIDNGGLASQPSVPISPYVTHQGNVEIESIYKGLILKDINGSCYETTVNNDGSLNTTLLSPCID